MVNELSFIFLYKLHIYKNELSTTFLRYKPFKHIGTNPFRNPRLTRRVVATPLRSPLVAPKR